MIGIFFEFVIVNIEGCVLSEEYVWFIFCLQECGCLQWGVRGDFFFCVQLVLISSVIFFDSKMFQSVFVRTLEYVKFITWVFRVFVQLQKMCSIVCFCQKSFCKGLILSVLSINKVFIWFSFFCEVNLKGKKCWERIEGFSVMSFFGRVLGVFVVESLLWRFLKGIVRSGYLFARDLWRVLVFFGYDGFSFFFVCFFGGQGGRDFVVILSFWYLGFIVIIVYWGVRFNLKDGF